MVLCGVLVIEVTITVGTSSAQLKKMLLYHTNKLACLLQQRLVLIIKVTIMIGTSSRQTFVRCVVKCLKHRKFNNKKCYTAFPYEIKNEFICLIFSFI